MGVNRIGMKETIARWFDEGVKQGATHMIVAFDTFDHEDFPHYVMPGQDAREVAKPYDDESKMLRLMEVYDLKRDRDEQVNLDGRVFNYGDEGSKVEAPSKTDDLVPILRALTEATSVDDPRTFDNTGYCPPTLDFTASPGRSARHVRADLALRAAEEDVQRGKST